ncbi:MAG: amidohydrolase family protein, partial [Parafilimonas sp.]
MLSRFKFVVACIILLQTLQCKAQSNQHIDFETYDPVSTLVVPQHPLHKAKFPFIDVHNHQWEVPNQNIPQLFAEMDSLNMMMMVNLSGRSYKETKAVNGEFDVNDHDYLLLSMENVKKTDVRRLIFFTNISFVGFGEPGWTEKTLRELESDVKAGACGLKIYKDLGFYFKDEKGKMIAIDDARLDTIWNKCGELKIPVLIHSADPRPFWFPFDKHNERWLELATHPDRKRSDTDPAPWDTLIAEQHRVFKKHPNTTFIAAHFGWYANDLATLGKLLDDMPNVYTEFGAVIAELGRQPRAAKAFFEKYQDRI